MPLDSVSCWTVVRRIILHGNLPEELCLMSGICMPLDSVRCWTVVRRTILHGNVWNLNTAEECPSLDGGEENWFTWNTRSWSAWEFTFMSREYKCREYKWRRLLNVRIGEFLPAFPPY